MNKQTRDASVEFYQANPAVTHRLIPWVRRELIVLFGCQQMDHINRLMADIIRGEFITSFQTTAESNVV